MVESPASFDRVTCLPPKNASAPWGGPGSRWLAIIVWQVTYVQYLLACQKSQRSTPYNIVKSGLPWKRVFRRRHLGRRVTAVTCLRWPTVSMVTRARFRYTQDFLTPGICKPAELWKNDVISRHNPHSHVIIACTRYLTNNTLTPMPVLQRWRTWINITKPRKNKSNSQIAKFMGPTWGPPGS